MLGFLKKSKETDGGIFAPVNGTCVDITSVPDQTFATKVLGEGVAFIYDGDTIYAPCSGIIRVVASTKHAVGIVNEAGIELLIHIGLDTVNLEGEGFEVFVKKDQKIRLGAPLVKIDRKVMIENNINLITPMVITNSDAFNFEFHHIGSEVKQGESVVITSVNGRRR